MLAHCLHLVGSHLDFLLVPIEKTTNQSRGERMTETDSDEDNSYPSFAHRSLKVSEEYDTNLHTSLHPLSDSSASSPPPAAQAMPLY